MRKRSGALHCETEEEYTQLAEQTMNTMGIFYDNPQKFQKNKEIAERQKQQEEEQRNQQHQGFSTNDNSPEKLQKIEENQIEETPYEKYHSYSIKLIITGELKPYFITNIYQFSHKKQNENEIFAQKLQLQKKLEKINRSSSHQRIFRPSSTTDEDVNEEFENFESYSLSTVEENENLSSSDSQSPQKENQLNQNQSQNQIENQKEKQNQRRRKNVIYPQEQRQQKEQNNENPIIQKQNQEQKDYYDNFNYSKTQDNEQKQQEKEEFLNYTMGEKIDFTNNENQNSYQLGENNFDNYTMEVNNFNNYTMEEKLENENQDNNFDNYKMEPISNFDEYKMESYVLDDEKSSSETQIYQKNNNSQINNENGNLYQESHLESLQKSQNISDNKNNKQNGNLEIVQQEDKQTLKKKSIEIRKKSQSQPQGQPQGQPQPKIINPILSPALNSVNCNLQIDNQSDLKQLQDFQIVLDNQMKKKRPSLCPSEQLQQDLNELKNLKSFEKLENSFDMHEMENEQQIEDQTEIQTQQIQFQKQFTSQNQIDLIVINQKITLHQEIIYKIWLRNLQIEDDSFLTEIYYENAEFPIFFYECHDIQNFKKIKNQIISIQFPKQVKIYLVGIIDDQKGKLINNDELQELQDNVDIFKTYEVQKHRLQKFFEDLVKILRNESQVDYKIEKDMNDEKIRSQQNLILKNNPSSEIFKSLSPPYKKNDNFQTFK